VIIQHEKNNVPSGSQMEAQGQNPTSPGNAEEDGDVEGSTFIGHVEEEGGVEKEVQAKKANLEHANSTFYSTL
jgi:hypothetical protein